MFDRIMQDPTEMDFGLNGGNIAQNGSNMLRIIKDRWTFDNPSTIKPLNNIVKIIKTVSQKLLIITIIVIFITNYVTEFYYTYYYR